MKKPCEERISFDTEREAIDFCIKVRQEQKRELASYLCQRCGKWHVYNKEKEDYVKTLVNQCLRKARYRTIGKAREVAEKAKQERGVELHAYRCPHCGSIHLTKFIKVGYDKIF